MIHNIMFLAYVLEGSERFIYLRENLLFDSTMRARPPSREKFVFASDSGRVINDALTNKVTQLSVISISPIAP